MATARARTGALRVVLGMAQMFGAVTAATLLLWTGLSIVTLLAVALTTSFTVISLLVFRRR